MERRVVIYNLLLKFSLVMAALLVALRLAEGLNFVASPQAGAWATADALCLPFAGLFVTAFAFLARGAKRRLTGPTAEEFRALQEERSRRQPASWR